MIITNKKMDYITIKEFAEKANVSASAIYQQMNSRLKPYVVMVNGKRRILKEALEVFYSNYSEDVSNSSEFKPKDKVSEADDISHSSQNISELQLLKATLETLQKELDRKEEALLAERKRVDELSSQLAEAFQKIARMGSEAQFLTSQTIGLIGSQPVPDGMTSTAPEIIIDADAPDVVQEKRKKKKKKKEKKNKAK